MKVTGLYEDSNNRVVLEIEFSPNQNLVVPNAIDNLEANGQLYTILANHLAGKIGELKDLPGPVLLIVIQLLSEALREVGNTGRALGERVKAGESAEDIYVDFTDRYQAEKLGDMPAADLPEFFLGFIEDDLDLSALDLDFPPAPFTDESGEPE